MAVSGELLPEALCVGPWPEGVVKSEKPLACPEISDHDEISQLFGIV